mmetsp:Transcript_132165/g.368417  ORF Transcript_132165/g.368417 Transcript_132165/m.368417 type:complete len:269 (-) Transcript_132165:1019-1825(-)
MLPEPKEQSHTTTPRLSAGTRHGEHLSFHYVRCMLTLERVRVKVPLPPSARCHGGCCAGASQEAQDATSPRKRSDIPRHGPGMRISGEPWCRQGAGLILDASAWRIVRAAVNTERGNLQRTLLVRGIVLNVHEVPVLEHHVDERPVNHVGHALLEPDADLMLLERLRPLRNRGPNAVPNSPLRAKEAAPVPPPPKPLVVGRLRRAQPRGRSGRRRPKAGARPRCVPRRSCRIEGAGARGGCGGGLLAPWCVPRLVELSDGDVQHLRQD